MATLGKAYVQIVPSADGISGSISNVLGGEVDSAGKEAGESLGSKLMATAKKVIAAAGIGKFISASLNEGGALQQSIGGVETLFKNSADQVKKYAAESFRTTGLSANEYMENVTGFSASLLQSLGGDTAKAADIANTAMIDMADNSNKMGTSMEAIQNAYAGFAKQNYTMLDNLKLGYGGTKTEMERLLKDATKLTGVKYDINNLADVYNAIHAVQGELGITGTTAKEASETLAGSFSAMKASFTDLLGNLSLGEDITPQLEALATTTSTWLFGNFLPMVGNILANVPTLIVGVLETGIPLFLEEGGKMLTSLSEGIATHLPTLTASAMETILGYVSGLGANISQIVTAGGTIISNLVTGIANTLPVLFSYVPQIIGGLVTNITANLPQIVQSGMTLITDFAKGVWENRGQVWEFIQSIMDEAMRLATDIDWVGLGMDIIDWISSGISALFNNIPTLVGEIGQLASDFFSKIDWSAVGSGAITLIGKGVSALISLVPQLLKSIGETGMRMVTSINWLSLGSDIIKGIVNGIKSAGSMLWNSLKSVAESALNSVKKFLKIGSPSKVFEDEVGTWIPEGVAVGIEANTKAVTDAMNDMAMDATAVPVAETISANRNLVPEGGSNYTTNNMGGVTININANDYNGDPFEIANAINDILVNDMSREGAVFG